MPGHVATRRKTVIIMDLAPSFHNFSTGIEHYLLKSSGRSPVGGVFAEAGVNASRDPAFLRFAGIYLENIPGRISGANRCFVVRARIVVNVNDITISVDEYYIKRYRDILHPVMPRVITVIDKEHTEPSRHVRPVHKPARLFLRRQRQFSLEPA